MAQHSFMTESRQDTEVLGRIGSIRSERPAWRRITGLSISFVAFILTAAGAIWWVIEHSHHNSDAPVGQRIGVSLVPVLAALAFGAALFRDFGDRRARATERVIRDLLVYKHDETRVEAQRMHDETVRRVEAALGRAVNEMDRRNGRHLATVGGMHEEQMDFIDATRKELLSGLLILERVMPELLAQTEWVAYAKAIRESMNDRPAVNGEAPYPHPVRRHGGQLRSVPSQHSN